MRPVKPIKIFFLAAALLGAALRCAQAWQYRGVVYEENPEDHAAYYGSVKSEKQMQHLKEIGVNTLLYAPPVYQKNMQQPEISFDNSLDDGMEKDIRTAKRLGFRVIFQPTLVPIPTGDDQAYVREPISMRSEEEWRRWFANYDYMIIHYAAIAQRLKTDVFVIGNGYERTTRDRDSQWRRIIKDVRIVYPQKLMYAARDIEEAQHIHFWTDLDLMGVNESGSEELNYEWAGAVTELARLSKDNADRPIVVMPLGYFSVHSDSGSAVDLQAQSFDAALTALDKKPWVEGVVISKYKISVTPKERSRAPLDADAVFQDKPAEAVIRRHFLQ
jgi:hypothetical protein